MKKSDNHIRLKEVREFLGLKQGVFSEMLGLRQNYLSRYETGEHEFTDDMKLKLVEIINQNFNRRVNLDWLISGNGEMFLEAQEKELQKSPQASEGYKIPLLRQKVSCGPGTDWQTENNIVKYIDVFDQIPHLKIKDLFAICVEGSSMLGAGIKHGDLVFFNSAKDQRVYDGIYVFALDNEVYCKRLEFDKLPKKIKVFSVRVADLEKADLLTILDAEAPDTVDRLHIFGPVVFCMHQFYDT